MPPQVNFRGGVRGKYLARCRGSVGITVATGSVEVSSVTSAGEVKAIVMEPLHAHEVSAPILRMSRGPCIAIAPEDTTAIANAV